MKEREIVYEVFVKTFNAHKSNVGNIKGINEKLEYLKSLGVTQVWISPFYESDFEDSGYDVINYYKVDPSLGTNKDFEELIEKANELDMKIMIDLVLNHCSDKNEWFQKALKGDKKYMEYFYFRDPKPDGSVPNNWMSKFGGSAWEYVEELDKYYMHLFTKNQPDFNWENEELRNEIIKILNFWIEKGVRGFRFDVCNLYSKAEGLPDDTTDYGGRNLYTNGPRMHEYLKFLNQNSFGNVKDFLTVGEMLTSNMEIMIEYVRQENKELDVIFDFNHMKVDFEGKVKWLYKKPDIKEFKRIITELQEYYQEQNCLLSLFFNNHDQPRSVSRFGNDSKYWYESATSFATYLYLQRGIPFVYQGEEIGMTNYNFKDNDDFFDVETKNNVEIFRNKGLSEEEIFKIVDSKCRDHSRTVMQWENKKYAGFSENEPQIKVNPNYEKINVADQLKDKNSILNFYSFILNMKKNSEALGEGKIEFLDKNSQLCSYKRVGSKDEYLIVANLFEEQLSNDLNLDFKDYEVLFNNYKDLNTGEFKPYQCVILHKTY
ncbi:trehalose-6-phosphate hydrolase [Spiroplasma chinense]|uniref:Trehalose-6-phosphate hydrolase n=1 Tax=Spiroplasma chinense TaxID=216932 RepID=A0A5B9Y4T4_9MOLU|nr:alpha-amylase family glycosyl hydrolase [Spiroplasma chinense]QEH62178.1 trehalose-6-phosphate hydrolase [Spiroplasma chinense]